MTEAETLKRARAILARGVFTREAILEAADFLRAMRASPDRAETTQIGSVGEADSTRSGEAGGAQDLTRVRIGDGQ